MTIYILLSVCMFISLMNLVATVLLSNSVFRLFGPNTPPQIRAERNDDSGLVDPAPTPTYDARFLSQNS